MRTRPCRASAFSLIEITLALSIGTFCLVAIFGLLPVGLNSNTSAIEQTAAASIASSINADLRATPPAGGASPNYGTSPGFGYVIPIPNKLVRVGAGAGVIVPTNPEVVYFSAGGVPTGAMNAPAVTSGSNGISRYCASVLFTPPGANQKTPTQVRIFITWPALSGTANWAGSFETLTALNRN